MEENKMKFLILLIFLCLTSCKTTDVNPTTSVLRFVITNGSREVEDATALYLNEKLMKVELDENFYAKDRYVLTYEELNNEKTI
jgi:hypothetical protein